MKSKNLLALLFIALVVTAGCKKDDDSNPLVGSFTLKGETFEILTTGSAPTGILQLIHDLAGNSTFGTLTITGANTSKTGVLQIAIDYTTSSGITGEYKNGNLNTGAHTFEPWLTSYSTTTLSGTNMITGNDATGTLTITKNASDSYTVSFNFIYADSTSATGNITQKYTVQEMNI